MSWVAPPTFVVGQVLTAAQQNILGGDLTYLFAQGQFQLDRVTGTGFACTATTEGTANTIITGTSMAYPASPTLVEFFAPAIFGSAELTGTIVLLRGATVLAGRWGDTHMLAGSASEKKPVKLEYRDASPPGGTYSYIVAGFTNTGTFTVSGGAGGSGAEAPAFLKTSLCP